MDIDWSGSMDDREMTWQEKFAAIRALGDSPNATTLNMRAVGSWSINLDPTIDIGGNGVIVHPVATGPDSESVVNNLWEKMTNLSDGEYIVVNGMSRRRRHVVWNGFLWEDLPKNYNVFKAEYE